MEVRIVKKPPAPQMDSFDIRGLEVDGVYVVNPTMGRYLVDGGYAKVEQQTVSSGSKRNQKRKRSTKR